MFQGLPIILSHHLPKKQVGTELVRVYPWWSFIYRVIWGCRPTPKRFKPGAPIMEDVSYVFNNCLYVSPEAYKEIKRMKSIPEEVQSDELPRSLLRF